MLDQRIEKLKTFYAQDPSNFILLEDLVDEFLRGDQLEQLVEYFKTFNSESHINAQICNKVGIAALTIGEFEFASSLFQNAYQTDATSAAVAYNLGFALYARQQFQECIDLLHNHLSDSEENPNLCLLMARCMHQTGSLMEALQWIEKVTSIQPDNKEAVGLNALILLDIGEYQKANSLGESTLVSNPLQLESLLACSGSKIAMGEYSEALPLTESGISAHPKVGRFWQYRGQIDMLNMKMEEAELHLKKAVTLMPNHIGSWHLLGWSQQLNNKLNLARESFLSAMALDRNFADSHGALALVDAMENKLEQADEHLKRSLKLDPLSATGNYAKCIILEKRGKQRDSEVLMRRILSSKAAKNALGLLPLIKSQFKTDRD